MHVVRLSYGGHLCSGAGEVSEFSPEEQTLHGVLSWRGEYIKELLFVSWVLVPSCFVGAFCYYNIVRG